MLLNHETPKTHSITVGNDASLTFNASVRSRTLTWDVPEVFRSWGIKFVTSLLDGALTKPVALGDVEMTNQGASGRGYECCRTKEAALCQHWDAIEYYCKNYRTAPPPIFTYMHKNGEVLPNAKAASQVRPIVYPPTHFYCLQKIHTQELDDRIKKTPVFFSYGKSVLKTHFHDVAQRLSYYTTLFKGDCTKFDSGIGPDAFSVICDIRKQLSDPVSHPALDYIYANLSHKIVQYPTTHLVLDTRQPSGQACTTSDNSLFHAFVVSTAFAMHWHEKHGVLPLIGEVHRNLGMFLYSDDHIGATNVPSFSLFETRSRLYNRFGCTLKKDDDQVGGHLSEYVYLGGRFTPHPHLPRFWCYYYDDPNLLRLLPLQTYNSNQVEICQTLASYATLVAPNAAAYAKVKELANRLSRLPAWFAHFEIPSRDAILSSYTNLESGELLGCASSPVYTQ